MTMLESAPSSLAGISSTLWMPPGTGAQGREPIFSC